MPWIAAQTAPATGTQLITLGTAGGPLPRADRAQSSNLLVVNGALYLIDAGGNVTSRVVQSGHDFRKIGKIFITHPHSDHTAGLATLMVSQWEYQRAEPTDIYGGGVAFSYRFDTLDRSFLFTGDTGWSDAVIDLAKGADVLVTEVTSTDDVIGLMKRNGAWQAKTESEQEGWLRHMHEEHVTPEEVGRFAAQAGVKTVVMTHLSPSPDPNDDFARYAIAAKKHFSGSVLIAKDLMKF